MTTNQNKINRRISVHDANILEFYQLPKALFKNEYKNLSNNDRVIYSLLLDRCRLSIMNHEDWHDEDGYIYLYFKETSLAEQSCVSVRTVQNCLSNLEKAGLISTVVQGANMPNRIYVQKPETSKMNDTQNLLHDTSGNEKFSNDTKKLQMDTQELPPNKNNTNKKENNNNLSIINNNSNTDVDVIDKIKQTQSIMSDYNISTDDATALLQAANYNIEKIQNAKSILNTQSSPINNIIGWMIKAIKNNYKTINKTATKPNNKFFNFTQREYSADYYTQLEQKLLSSF